MNDKDLKIEKEECSWCYREIDCVWLPNDYDGMDYPYCYDCLKKALNAFKKSKN